MDVFDEESGLHLPANVKRGWLDGEDGPLDMDSAVLDNQTGLPDDVIQEAARTYIEENSAYNLRNETPLSIYPDAGASLMARREFRTPADIPDEIRLARSLAERDDDVAAVLGEMIGLAFSDGVQARHKDEKTQAAFHAINESTNLEGALANMYREWLIAGQVTTTTLFTREDVAYELSGSDRPLSASMAVPRVGVLPSENIRVIGNDTLGTAVLAYDPDNERLARWLEEYFGARTTAARKAELGRKDRVSAAMFVGKVAVDPMEANALPSRTGYLYLLNPRIAQRSTMPKGAWKHPRPLMTRNFPLLEAKRLLNVMDFALLQGGSNFIVVAKKGSDQRPAKGREIQNLREVVRRASKVGVIVGDHRLSFEIITPKLDELLKPEKRKLLGRKMAMALMRTAENSAENTGGEGMEAEVEILSRIITWDRGQLCGHVQRNIYVEMVKRNPDVLKGPAKLWLLKLILQGTQYFNDLVLKLRDRGDISRRTAVEAGGFDYEGEKAERERELANGDDEILIPGVIPHTSPEQPGQSPNPADNGGGRPNGSREGEEPGPRKKQTIGKFAGETIKAWFDEDADRVVRMGRQTMALLEDYEDREVGRMTGNERAALDLEEPERIASTIYVPVNPGHETAAAKPMRLTDGLSVLIGYKPGGAMVAKTLCFRESDWTLEQAEELAVRWGFITEELTIEDPPGGGDPSGS
jgi:hypothetical protein